MLKNVKILVFYFKYFILAHIRAHVGASRAGALVVLSLLELIRIYIIENF